MTYHRGLRNERLRQPLDSSLLNVAWSRLRLLLLGGLVALAGCGGCQRDSKQSAEELKKLAEEKVKSLEILKMRALPSDSDTVVLTAKAGHWYETRQEFKSNREDLQVVAVGSITRGRQPAELPGTNVLNQFTRRTSLPRGQTKGVDLQFFIPPAPSSGSSDPLATASTALGFQTELLLWPLMTPLLSSPESNFARELKPNEYHLVALGPQATSYEYLAGSDAIYWRGDDLMTDERTRSYAVSIVKPQNNRYAMPNSMLTMTSTAVIVWDDVSADDLSLDQQLALVDWLHWGGQLVVSGPGSWSRLQNSFLSPYLPAISADATELTTEDFAELSQRWVVEDLSDSDRSPLTITGPPVAGLEFTLGEDGSWLPETGQLVAERRVGRGRVVLTSFPLREPRIFRWKYFSSFLSTGLLRRAPRIARRRDSDRTLAQLWATPHTGDELDPRLHSNFRVLTRDLPLTRNTSPSTNSLNLPGNASASEAMSWGGQGASWNDYSGLAYRAVDTLRAAAGIELPSRKTIIYLLGGYLLCLVPLNWIVFRVIGRLEFAWIAAPIMAVVGVIAVTRIARLDIGFARRTTEVSILELHGNHHRGHLTQFIALYTSLSTNYAVQFPENGSVALPLGDMNREQRRAASEQRIMQTNYGRSQGVTLEPVTVYSNSTEMLHAEQMVDLVGGLQLGNRGGGQAALKNETGLDLKAALVIRRTDSNVEFDWLGDLPSGQAATLSFEAVRGQALSEAWSGNPVTQETYPDEAETESDDFSLWLGGVMHEVLRKTPLAVGQSRLIAYTESRPGNLELTPSQDQFDGRCVVVAHLTPADLAKVVPDVSIMSRPSPLEVVPTIEGAPDEAQALP